ncbi:MAG: hypothetical protein QXX17_03350 [Conexivisphaerales archaeon]
MLDISLAVILIYFSIWVYELMNVFVGTVLGAQTVLQLQGLYPSGVIASSIHFHSGLLLKVLQVVLSSSSFVPLLIVSRKAKLKITQIAILSVISLYFASFTWEALSLFTNGSQVERFLVFVALSFFVQQLLVMLTVQTESAKKSSELVAVNDIEVKMRSR